MSKPSNVILPLASQRGKYASRLGAGAPVYLAAVLEYLTAEVLELAGNAVRDNKKQRVTPRYILLAIRNDQEMSALLSEVSVADGGVLPNIHSYLNGYESGLRLRKAERKSNSPCFYCSVCREEHRTKKMVALHKEERDNGLRGFGGCWIGERKQ